MKKVLFLTLLLSGITISSFARDYFFTRGRICTPRVVIIERPMVVPCYPRGGYLPHTEYYRGYGREYYGYEFRERRRDRDDRYYYGRGYQERNRCH